VRLGLRHLEQLGEKFSTRDRIEARDRLVEDERTIPARMKRGCNSELRGNPRRKRAPSVTNLDMPPLCKCALKTAESAARNLANEL
jgi:hypothetical protein